MDQSVQSIEGQVGIEMVMTYSSLEVNSPALIQPEMLPGAVGHQVAAPAVGQLVGNDIDILAVLIQS